MGCPAFMDSNHVFARALPWYSSTFCAFLVPFLFFFLVSLFDVPLSEVLAVCELGKFFAFQCFEQWFLCRGLYEYASESFHLPLLWRRSRAARISFLPGRSGNTRQIALFYGNVRSITHISTENLNSARSIPLLAFEICLEPIV